MRERTLAEIDGYLKTLREQVGSLKALNKPWADRKAQDTEAVLDYIFDLRREKLMQGAAGRRIVDPDNPPLPYRALSPEE